ncbi:MAG: AMP-binding protein [Candidatus Hodarchaeales archaeon]
MYLCTQNGVKKGDVVSINLFSCPQYITVHYRTLLAGAVASGLSPLLTDNEIIYQLNDSQIFLQNQYSNIVNKRYFSSYSTSFTE